MSAYAGSALRGVLCRAGVWFIALLLAISLFSFLFILVPLFGTPSAMTAGNLFEGPSTVFLATGAFALPAACLYLPVVIGLKDAEGHRFWIILLSGILIGPVCMTFSSYYDLWQGEDPHLVWYGDPLVGIGGKMGIVFATIVGSLTVTIYVVTLRAIHRRIGKTPEP